MAARTYGSLPLSCFTAAQLQALAEKDIQIEDINEGGCSDPSLNTCERDALSLLEQYPIYDSTLRYRIGDQALVINNDGLLIILYLAIANGPLPSGPFNPSLWSEVCRVNSSIPLGLLEISQILNTYDFYNNNYEYGRGNIVLKNSNCDDLTCVYIATSSIPAGVNPPSSPWLKLYCLKNGEKGRCEKQMICPSGKKIIYLSSDKTNPVCVPIESADGIGPDLKPL